MGYSSRDSEDPAKAAQSQDEHELAGWNAPVKMLFCSPIILRLSLYMDLSNHTLRYYRSYRYIPRALVYGYIYLVFTTMLVVFEETFNFSEGGQTYVPGIRHRNGPCIDCSRLLE